MKDKTTITIDRDTHKDLMLFKINSSAKDLNEIIKKAIKLLKEMERKK